LTDNILLSTIEKIATKAAAVFHKIVKLVKNGVLMIIPIYAKVSNTKFKKQLNQKTPLPTTQIFNKTILT
jgi:hypothetical protein